MSKRHLALVPIAMTAAVSLAFALSACAPEPEASPLPTSSETPTPTPTATQAATERTFTMPADCLGILPASRQQAFDAQGLDLLGGPGGKFDPYYADPTPEERAGGISCIWGDEAIPESTITVSVAPITQSARGAIVDTLISQGLNEVVLEDGISYAQIGDETSAPAVLNIIRDDSWISVIQALGGESVFNAAVELANEVADQAYTA